MSTSLMDTSDNEESRPLLGTKGRSHSTHSHRNTEDDVSPFEESYSSAPFAWAPFIAILFMGIVQPMCFELIFPFINQMIVENGITEDPERVGFYSGLIESIFQVMSFIAILPSSYISDHYGRKPVVLFGTTGMALSISLFGISKNYYQMIVTRCIGGTLGGTWSALKVMMAEIYTNRVHRASALSTFQIAFRVGQIAGQPLGGLLSHPARTMPIFNTSFWKTYPFSLPCFIAAGFAVTSVICAYFALEETLPGRLRPSIDPPSATESEQAVSGASLSEGPRVKVTSIASVLTPHVTSVLGSIFVMTFVSETVFALYPLFAFTPIESGGLGLSEPQIGAHMAIRSALNIFILFTYAPFASRIGAVRIYHFGMVLWPFVIASLPILNALARSNQASIGSMPFNMILLGFLGFFILWSLGNLVWPSSQIVVIEAAPTPEALARVNSLAQMVQTFTMALAPATVTSLFAFSIKNQILGGNFTYAVMLILGCGGALHSLTLKEPRR